nr:peptidoglycan DD-metalloendopeptidase family protein [Simiduia aestuariiviva]
MGWPTKGTLKARFGSNRAGNSLRWQGVLIGAPEGREVKAIHQGRVVFSEYMRGQGMLIIIDHGDNYLSLYAHNQVLYKETGDWVASGDVIARVGASGGQQDPNLYFEIRHAGKPVDPAHWCRG